MAPSWDDVAQGAEIRRERIERSRETPIQIQARHREMIRLASTGMSASDIARVVGCCYATVSSVLRSPLHRAAVYKIQDNLDEGIITPSKAIFNNARKALELEHRILTTGSIPEPEPQEGEEALSRSERIKVMVDALNRSKDTAPVTRGVQEHEGVSLREILAERRRKAVLEEVESKTQEAVRTIRKEQNHITVSAQSEDASVAISGC